MLKEALLRMSQPGYASKRNLLATVAAATALTIAAAQPAHAVPAYGYAELGFTNFTLSGIVGPTGGLETGVSGLTDSVLLTNGANYPGSTPGGGSASGDLVSGADVAQATSGPGGFPGENVFTQQLTSSSGTRGDGLITGAIATGATSTLVSEGRLTTGPGSAGSNAGSSTTITATFDVTSSLTIGLSFNAFVNLLATVGNLGDNATALTTASFSIQNLTTGQFVSICDLTTPSPHTCTTAGTSQPLAEVAPSALNESIGTTTPGSPASFTSPSTFYNYSAALVPDEYRVELGDTTQDILSTARPTIPEPISSALLGTGLIALGLIRRRRKI
jgi:hypothetical protein